MKASGVLLVMLLLVACDGTTSAPDADGQVPTVSALATGCPPADAPLRHPSGVLRGGAVGVRLCPDAPHLGGDGTRMHSAIQAPADELTTDVAALVDLVNGLPGFDPASECHFDDGPHHVYWFRYPDGDSRAVTYVEGGCHTLGVGPERALQSGEQLATAFADALLEQRSGAVPPTGGDVEPTCPAPPMSEPTSVLPQAPLAMTSATLCQLAGPAPARGTAIAPRLLRRLNDALLGQPVGEDARCDLSPEVHTIEGINAWGDRVSYFVSRCHVVARTGFGRGSTTTTFQVDRDLHAALVVLPVQR